MFHLTFFYVIDASLQYSVYLTFDITLRSFHAHTISQFHFIFYSVFIMMSRIFKYLHSITKFTAIDKKNDFLIKLNVLSPPIKPMKFTFNRVIVKMFCEIEKNNAKTKKRKHNLG